MNLYMHDDDVCMYIICVHIHIGMTPLLIACENGNEECVAKLLLYGADVTIYDKHHRSPLHITMMMNHHHNHNHHTTGSASSSGSGSASMTVNNDTVLPCNTRDISLTIIQLLLEAKHSLTIVDDMKRTPLHMAIMTPSLPAVELLLESRMRLYQLLLARTYTNMIWYG